MSDKLVTRNRPKYKPIDPAQLPKEEPKPPKSNDPFPAYYLEQVDGINWRVVELTIQNDKILNVRKDVESTKQIKAAKLIDLILTGKPLNAI